MQEGALTGNHETLKTYTWIPDGKIRALVFITHGYLV